MEKNLEKKGTPAKSKASIITMLSIGGAYASYQIGAGSASGQEALQFFVSYGSKWALTLPIFVAILIAVYCVIIYRRGQQFETAAEAYTFYCGKYIGKLFDYFSTILIAGFALGLYSSCGASLNMYLGISPYVGACIMAVIVFVTVILGLERLVDILGVCGILIFLCMVVVAIMALFNPLSSMAETDAAVPELLEDGTILKATMFGIDNPIVTAFNYTGITLLTAFPFLIALSKRTKNQAEVVGSSITSGVFFTGTIYVGAIIVLLSLVKLCTIDSGLQLPNLAACKAMFPTFSYVVLIILTIAIYSSIAGYSWVVGRRFAKEGSWLQKVIYIAMAIIGIFTGSFIPFNQIVNYLYPFSGIVGLIIFALVIITEIRIASKKNSLPAEAE